MNDYATLVLCGHGAIGSSFLSLARDLVVSFDEVVVIDKRATGSGDGSGIRFVEGDIENAPFLAGTLSALRRPFLLLNTASGTDNLRIRRMVSDKGGAYIDASCSMIRGENEYRYSILMPYSHRDTANARPHFVCAGVNPGMVEIVARRIIHEHFRGSAAVDIELYEYDGFECELGDGKVAVSWSPETLVDEVVLSPTFRLEGGRPVEGENPPTDRVSMQWNGRTLPARLVGHEEVWNFQMLGETAVHDSFFAYGFGDRITGLLALSGEEARERAALPSDGNPVAGVDTIVVKVVDRETGAAKTMRWATDHAVVQERFGVNAVQFQVSSSLALFVELLLRAGGWAAGRTLCGSTLPIEHYGWETILSLMERYMIEWRYCNGSFGLDGLKKKACRA